MTAARLAIVDIVRQRDELLAVLKDVELVINPRDRGGISLHEWNSRLRVASAIALTLIAKVEGEIVTSGGSEAERAGK